MGALLCCHTAASPLDCCQRDTKDTRGTIHPERTTRVRNGTLKTELHSEKSWKYSREKMHKTFTSKEILVCLEALL